MNKDRSIIIFVIVLTVLSVVYMFYDYQILLGGNKWLWLLVTRWATFLLLLILFLFLSISIKKKLLIIVVSLIAIVGVERYKPIRPYAMKSFLKEHMSSYSSVIELSEQNNRIHLIDLKYENSVTFKDVSLNDIPVTSYKEEDLSKIAEELLMIGVTRVIIENDCIIFFHADRTNETSGLIYYGKERQKNWCPRPASSIHPVWCRPA